MNDQLAAMQKADQPRVDYKDGLPVRATLLVSFALIAALVATYAAWSVRALGEAEATLERTYDQSMTALNALRAAEAVANDIPGSEGAAREALLDELAMDLLIVAERAPGVAAPQADAMAADLARWRAEGAPTDAQARMDDAFLVLSELLAGDAYIEREAAISGTARSVRLAWIGLAGVILAAIALTVLLSHLIVAPLVGAASAARRISEGDFAADLPDGSGAEVRALLRSMRVMQGSISKMLAAEKDKAATAEALLAGAIAHAADGVLLVDGNGRILTANGQAEAIAGTALPEGSDFEAALADADLSADAVTLLDQGGEAKIGDRWVRAATAGGDEAAGSRVVIWADITDLKTREAALEAASAAKTRFLATISHELKTPLNAVIGFSDLLRTEAMGPLGDDSYKDFAGEIHKAGSGLLNIISDILSFANAQSADYAHDGDSVDIARLAERIAETLTGDPDFAALDISCEARGSLASVMGREIHLTRAVGHLADNAAHFAAKGGGHVRLTTTYGGGEITLEIADDGPGMSPEELARAQGLFDQVDGSLTRQHEGLGLGLPLARSIIEGHGGRLLIESEEGVGTTVRVILPAGDGMQEAAA